MARSRKKTQVQTETPPETPPAGATDFNPDEFDRQLPPAVRQVAETPAEQLTEHNGNGHAPGHAATPGGTRRENYAATARKTQSLPDKLTVPAGDLKVQMIDKGDNRAGIGIRVAVPEGRSLSAEEKDVIRTVMNEPKGEYPSGFKYNGMMWHKEIGGNTPGYVAAAIRADAESRTEKLAAALQRHLDREGFAARIEKGRAQASEGRIPD